MAQAHSERFYVRLKGGAGSCRTVWGSLMTRFLLYTVLTRVPAGCLQTQISVSS